VCLDAEKVKDKARFFFFFFVKEEMSFKCGRGREGKRCNNKSGFGETRSWETSRYVADFAWNDSWSIRGVFSFLTRGLSGGV
jgi:hypothetical protein